MAKRSTSHNHEQKPTVVNRIESIINTDSYQAEYKKPDEFMGRPFIIMGYEVLQGRMGDFVHIEVIDVTSEQVEIISTGGGLIMKALNDLQERNAFPVVTTFGKSGNAYVFKPANIGRNFDLNSLVQEYLGANDDNQPFQPPLSE